MSAKTRGKTTTASRDTRIPSEDIDFNESEDDDVLVVVAEREKKRPRVEYPTIKRIVRHQAVDATPRAGASDISTRLERIEAAQTKLTTFVTSKSNAASASTEQLGNRIQKLEKSNGEVMKRLERVEALLEKVLERLG